MEVPAEFIREAAEADNAKRVLLRLEAEGVSWQAEARRLVPEPANVASALDRVILFTGHRIDSLSRNRPRFPASAEPAARQVIEEMVRQQKALANGPVMGIAGGANGGDILFLEACVEADVDCLMALALPPDQFIRASVQADSGDWVARFESLRQKVPSVVLAGEKKLPAWCAAKPGYDFWQRNNLWLIAQALVRQPAHFVLAALWDGKAGDGPGGTAHMVELAEALGAEFIRLDMNGITRSAAL